MWQNIKICCSGKNENKANFWVTWNGERFFKNRDAKILENKYPFLFSAVKRILFKAGGKK
jgi:hypothetical protein